MIQEMQALMSRCANWAKEQAIVRQTDEGVEITTAYIDRHNDFLQVLLHRAASGALALAPEGHVPNDFEQSAAERVSKARRSYHVHSVAWSSLAQTRQELST